MLILMNAVLIQILLALPLEGSQGLDVWKVYVWACTSFGLAGVFVGQMILSMNANRWARAAVFGLFVAACAVGGVWAQQAQAAGSWEFAMSPPFLEASMRHFGHQRLSLMVGFLTVANFVVSARILKRF